MRATSSRGVSRMEVGRRLHCGVSGAGRASGRNDDERTVVRGGGIARRHGIRRSVGSDLQYLDRRIQAIWSYLCRAVVDAIVRHGEKCTGLVGLRRGMVWWKESVSDWAIRAVDTRIG